MNNLFLVHTPYHIILASALAIELPLNSNNNVMLLYNDFSLDNLNLSRFYELFSSVTILAGNSDIKKTVVPKSLQAYQLFIRNMKIFRRITENICFSSVFVFNNLRPENIRIVEETHQKNKGKIVYVEDGSAAYSSSENSAGIRRTLKSLVKAKIYGGSLVDHKQAVMGLGSSITHCAAIYPELVREELKRKSIQEIKTSRICEAAKTIFRDDINGLLVPEQSIIVLLDLYSSITPIIYKYTQVLEIVFALSSSLGIPVLFKYHPRETSSYVESMKEKFDNAFEVKRTIPSEAVFLALNEKSVVISSTSTSLITLRKIRPEILGISTMLILGLNDESLKKVFSAIGLSLPLSVSELSTIIREAKVK